MSVRPGSAGIDRPARDVRESREDIGSRNGKR